jgi:hypothetical protein
MHRVVGPVVALAVVALVLGGCSTIGDPEVTAEQRSWCTEHQIPDLEGGPSVAAAARRLGIASPEVERTLGAVEATYGEGARLAGAAVAAEAAGDPAAVAEARAAYLAWQSDVAFPAQQAAAQAIGTWSTTPEWAEACASAWGERGSAPASQGPPAAAATEAPEPTTAPTATPKPEPTPRLTAGKTINYTSSTYVGRIIKLTIKVRNPGKLKAGKVSVQVEGVGYSLKSRTPIVGCIPNCKAATGAEGIGYVQWTAPAPGKSRSYTVQLKAKRAGTYRIEVRAYHGPAGDPVDDLASWTVKVRVR